MDDRGESDGAQENSVLYRRGALTGASSGVR